MSQRPVDRVEVRGYHSEDSPLPPSTEHLVYPTQLPRFLRVPVLACRRDRSFPSAGRLLSHSHHVIPFPVSHQEFWPFSLCHSPGRQQAKNVVVPTRDSTPRCLWLRVKA